MMRSRLLCMIFIFICVNCVGSKALAGDLDNAVSPYLLSHRNDPIAWRQWDDRSLAEAREKGKPIFLSIGFAACHWCHVMARTTFRDADVVSSLNDNFVAILVDQEERPDIARYYFEAMAAMTGRSGSPANFILAPNLTPIFAAGYMSAKSAPNQQGLAEVLKRFTRDWANDANRIRTNAEAFLKDMSESRNRRVGDSSGDTERLAAKSWLSAFDSIHGGFGGQPKFVYVNVLDFLLNDAGRRGDQEQLRQVFFTLEAMAAGGLRDHLGGAFHRYCVDRAWQIPHFEVMLRENALLATLYIDAYRAADSPVRRTLFERIARAILDDLSDTLRLSDGTFAGSLDAEAEGVNGGYYTWTVDEIESVLGLAAENFVEEFVDPIHGLVEGRSVLRWRGGVGKLGSALDRHSKRFQLLKQARTNRAPPKRDEKIITAWNAMAISAYARAAQVFGEPRYLELARGIAKGLKLATTPDIDLSRSRYRNKSSNDVFLEDYAYAVLALLDLYESDFDPQWLDRARRLANKALELFHPRPEGLLQMTPVGRARAVSVQTPFKETTLPSGNAAIVEALLRLELYGPDKSFLPRSNLLLRAIDTRLTAYAAQATGMLAALAFRPERAREIVIVGPRDHPNIVTFLNEIRTRKPPGSVVAWIPPGPASGGREHWLLLGERHLLDKLPTVYVCRDRICRWPVNTLADLRKQLSDFPADPER